MTAVARTRTTSAARLVGSAAASKIAVMAVSGLLGIVTSKLIIGTFGTGAYAQYGLLTSFPGLLPFADLGIAAIVINRVAESSDVRSDATVRRTLTTAFRILLVSGGLIGLTGVGITLLGLWPTLLGAGLLPGVGSVTALVCLLVFGAVLPMTVGQRVLVGLHRTTTQIATQAVVAPFMLVTIGTSALLALPVGGYLAIFSYVGNGLVSVLCLVAVARAISPQLGHAIRDVPRLRSVPSEKVLGVTWPMLAQMLALPIAMQTDRLLISHLAGGQQLAQYNLASQLFGLILQTISAAGIVLWPIYARARAQASVQSPAKPTVVFAAGGFSVATVLALVSPWLVAFVAGGRIVLDGWIVWGFALFCAVQAAKYPLGMYMTDKAGLRFQVWPILVMVPLNLGLSWLLVLRIGAAGPILGSTVAVLLCQVLPNLWYVRRDLARRRAEAAKRS